MNRCSQLDEYLNKTLSADATKKFDEHLVDCSSCRGEVSSWQSIEYDIRDWSKNLTMQAPTKAEAASLVVGLKPRKKTKAIQAIMAAAAIFGLIVTSAYLFIQSPEEPTSPAPALAKKHEQPLAAPINAAKKITKHPQQLQTQSVRVLYSVLNRDYSQSRLISVPSEGHMVVELGDDRIGLDALTELKIISKTATQTRLKLQRGSISIEAAPREVNQVLVIESVNLSVMVTGTRFNVSCRDGQTTVSVEEGAVRVTANESLHQEVKAGHSFEMDKDGNWNLGTISKEKLRKLNSLLEIPQSNQAIAEAGEKTSEPAVSRPDRDSAKKWRSLIMNGHYREADHSLTTHLKTSNRDVEAWKLLAGCKKKQGNWTGAVDAYGQVIKLGSSRNANLARLESAIILQDKLDDHKTAAKLLERYLESPSLQKAEAMIRLARCQIRNGQVSKAKSLLETVIQEHRGTTAAVQAIGMLDQISR